MPRPPKHGMQKENLGVRLQVEWIAEMKEIAQQTGGTLSDIAIEAIGTYLGKDVNTVSNDLSDLKQRVAELEHLMGKLTARSGNGN